MRKFFNIDDVNKNLKNHEEKLCICGSGISLIKTLGYGYCALVCNKCNITHEVYRNLPTITEKLQFKLLIDKIKPIQYFDCDDSDIEIFCENCKSDTCSHAGKN